MTSLPPDGHKKAQHKLKKDYLHFSETGEAARRRYHPHGFISANQSSDGAFRCGEPVRAALSGDAVGSASAVCLTVPLKQGEL